MKDENPADQLHEANASARLSYAVEKVRDYAIFLLDNDGVVLTWNGAAELMKGYAPDEVIGNNFAMLYTDEDQQNGAPARNLALAAEHGTHQEETWRQKKDGSHFWALVEIIAIKTSAGEMNGFCKITRDLTTRKQLQDFLATEKERAQVTLRAIGDAVISVDAQGKIDFLNPEAEALTGWTAPEALGWHFSEVVHLLDKSRQRSPTHQSIAELMQEQLIAPHSRAVLESKSGAHFAVEGTAEPILMPDGRVAGGVIVLRDVTQSREQQTRIAYQATHDALTRLVNKTEFEKRLQRSIERAQQSHATGAILFMDLDRFKIVNDTCGHAAGDQLLKQLAQLYGKEVRERDTLARLGGDEFGLIVDHCTREEAHSIAKKILRATNAFQFICNERAFTVGVSIGLVTFNETVSSIEELLQRADQACYLAKENGRNQISSPATSDAEIEQRNLDRDWVSRLNDAMHLDQLQLHYQPIASVEGDASRLRYDVLLRLRDPDKGLLLPGNFFPAAERYGLMPKIDRWVVSNVAQWLGGNQTHADMLDFCVIHLSAQTLSDTSFLPFMADLFRDAQPLAAKICFQFTESSATVDMAQCLNLVEGLQSFGCRVCIGRFGRGMASFAALKQLPVDFVKIDGSFVSVITNSLVDEKMIRLVNELVHLMGKKTIAEWVEDEETATILSHIGIDYLQGHWISYPKELASSQHPLH